MLPLRLTISQRLWLGLGLILALFGAAHYVSVRATQLLDTALSGVVEDSGARRLRQRLLAQEARA